MKTELKVKRLREKMKALAMELFQIQEGCDHANAKKVAKSDTGNFCKADDEYWLDCDCPVCGKFWRERQ